jgi:hypothetical protein
MMSFSDGVQCRLRRVSAFTVPDARSPGLAVLEAWLGMSRDSDVLSELGGEVR